jgi:host factor-I protein
MTYEKSVNVHDVFLNYLRKNKVPVTIFLLNGVKLNGTISGFDRDVVALRKDGYTQLMYRHAISTFCPHGPINIFGWGTQSDSESEQDRIADSQDDLDQPQFSDDSEDEVEY